MKRTLGLLVVVLSAAQAQADIIAKTSYTDYPSPNSTLTGQSGPDDVGFSSTWSSSSANLQAEAGGILDGDPDSGQGKFLAAPGDFSLFSRIARRDLDAAAVSTVTGNTFYMSHLVNAGSSVGPNQEYALVGFGNFTEQSTIEGTANFLGGAFTGFVGNGTGGIDLVIRSRTTTGSTVEDEVLITDAENTTYNVVMALEFDNPGDEIRYWVDPTDFGNGEAGLTSSAVLSGTIAGFQLSGSASMNDLTVAINGFDRSFFWDESILADDVAGLNPIPEPTALALLAAGLLAGVARRR